MARTRVPVLITGSAMAPNVAGRADGLPTAASGRNNEWWWGLRLANQTVVIAVEPGRVTAHQTSRSSDARSARAHS
jgi:hypothetical protein